jgi:flagellar motor protein MotB
MLSSVTRAAVEGFMDLGNAERRRETYVDFVSAVLAFILAMVILSFVGKLLWNGIVVDLFSFAKPARSIWQILGLMIFVSLVLGH